MRPSTLVYACIVACTIAQVQSCNYANFSEADRSLIRMNNSTSAKACSGVYRFEMKGKLTFDFKKHPGVYTQVGLYDTVKKALKTLFAITTDIVPAVDIFPSVVKFDAKVGATIHFSLSAKTLQELPLSISEHHINMELSKHPNTPNATLSGLTDAEIDAAAAAALDKVVNDVSTGLIIGLVILAVIIVASCVACFVYCPCGNSRGHGDHDKSATPLVAVNTGKGGTIHPHHMQYQYNMHGAAPMHHNGPYNHA